MGTMSSATGCTEADFRGERFAEHPHDLQGQQRPARADPARRHRADPRGVPRGRRGHRRDQHLQRHADRAGRLRPASTLVRELNLGPRALAARGRRRRGPRGRRTSRASWPARSGPTNRTLSISPDVNDPGVPRRHLRRAARRLRRAGRGAGRGRRRPAAARDDLRHAQRSRRRSSPSRRSSSETGRARCR